MAVEWLCLKCNEVLHIQDVCRDTFPVTHRGCGGEAAARIDIDEAMSGILQPQERLDVHSVFGPHGDVFRKMMGVDQSQTEQFIRWLYGVSVRCVDRVGGDNRELSLDEILQVLKAFEERQTKRRRMAIAERIEVMNTLYGSPFECECGETSKNDPCVHCGRPHKSNYVKPGDGDGEV